MQGDTRERILQTALALFAERGYAGTSMSDIAGALGLSKAALYRHYESKQAIFDSIVARMEVRDREQAHRSGVPQDMPGESGAADQKITLAQLCAFSKAMFRYWTQDAFASAFRRMLTLEQYRDPEMAKRYQHYLGSGPVSYMEELFGRMTGNAQEARQLALSFYGPIVVLYSIYDETGERDAVLETLRHHVTWFSHVLEQTSREGAESDD